MRKSRVKNTGNPLRRRGTLNIELDWAAITGIWEVITRKDTNKRFPKCGGGTGIADGPQSSG